MNPSKGKCHQLLPSSSYSSASSSKDKDNCYQHHHRDRDRHLIHQHHRHHPSSSFVEKGIHASRISTMPHRSVGTGSISPVSNMIAYTAGNYSHFRRDSGGSSGSDRRGSGGSAYRRDSGESTNSSRGRKDSGDSTTATSSARIVEDAERSRRDSGSSDKSEETKKKRGIFRQLIKWSSPGHRLKSRKEKGKVTPDIEPDVTEKVEGEAAQAEAEAQGNGKEETETGYREETQFKMSTEFSRDTRAESPSPLTSPNKRSDSRASTLTDVTNSRSDSECSSCSVSGSCSCSEDEEDVDIKKLEEDILHGARSIGRGNHSYRSYYPYYHDDPRRVRSQSLDYVRARKEIRKRRFSENNDWIRNDKPKKEEEVAQEEDEDEPKAYTIYQSILKEMGRRGSLHSHRPADALIDPVHAAILFRDSRGLPVVDPFLERILTLSDEDQTEILVKFFKFHKCYDLIPTSAKLVVFDTQLLVKKAFFALVYNGVRAAPLWDSSVRQFVGMLTITDFIRVLHAMYHDSAGRMAELEEHRIETWRRRFLQDKQPIIFIDPDASLFDAICTLVNNRIHRLPIIDQQTGNVLHILTHKRILKFLFLYVHEIPRPAFLTQKLGDVRIGTYEGVETAREDTSIIQALQKFLDRRVSALPIVDEQNRLLDIYARFDVINLAAEKTYNNLDITLKQANEHRNEWFEGVHKCNLDETLFVIMERIVKAEVHRLVVVDEQDRVVGVLSLSDILQYLVMRPEVKDIKAPDLKELMSRGESPMPDVTTPTSQPDPSTPSPTDDDPLAQLEEETNEANNNSLSPSDLNGSRDNPTIIEEEDEKV